MYKQEEHTTIHFYLDIVEVSTKKKKKLYSYIYHEGEGKKGGDNVVSLLWKYLNDISVININFNKCKNRCFRGDNTDTHDLLSIVMDNCCGQNKNKMVMRFGMYLFEMNIYKKV